MTTALHNDTKKSIPRSVFAALIDIRHPVHRIMLLIVVFALLLPDCTFMFFRPTRQFIDDPLVTKYAPQDIFFKSLDGVSLHGWHFRARNEKGAVLICHGNAENISTHAKLDLWLVDAGYSVFIFDYRGFGRSEGTPDIRGVHRDAEAALETLLFTLPRERKDGVFVFGKSLGARSRCT
jgi:uncharacterized protein